jgi:nicotinate-nucleotide adenylyltransferase
MSADVVVLGGTFDPVHNGHLRILEEVLDRTGSGRGLLVPAARPNLRAAAEAPAELRLAMLLAAVADDHPRLAVDDLELRRGGVSYTVDTMRQLRAAHPECSYALLLGADAARRIEEWDRAADLLREEAFIVVNRSGRQPPSAAELERIGFPPQRTQLLTVDSPAVSASEVRARVADGKTLDGLVPATVAAIIEREHLYSAQPRRA